MMNATCHSDVDSLCEGSITHIPAGQTGLGLQLNVADPRRGHANGTDVGLKKADYSAHEHVIVLALFTDCDDQYEALFEELAWVRRVTSDLLLSSSLTSNEKIHKSNISNQSRVDVEYTMPRMYHGC